MLLKVFNNRLEHVKYHDLLFSFSKKQIELK